MIPSNLISIVRIVNNDKNCIKMSFKCHCGCEHFKLFKKKKNKNEVQRDKKIDKMFKTPFRTTEIQNDSKGNLFIIQKNLLNREIKRISYDPTKEFWNFVSIQCDLCDSKYVIFDERFHGYEACISPRNECDDIDSITYSNQASRVNVVIYYSNDLEDVEEFIKDKTLAFGRIKIYSINGIKKTTILDCECS